MPQLLPRIDEGAERCCGLSICSTAAAFFLFLLLDFMIHTNVWMKGGPNQAEMTPLPQASPHCLMSHYATGSRYFLLPSVPPLACMTRLCVLV